jgi:NTE family protein
MMNYGLVLSGGGARAGYQVGVLRALVKILDGHKTPFNILAGLSAGAINCTALAIRAHDFPAAVEHLYETWRELQPHKVYKTNTLELMQLGTRWVKDLTTGGLLGKSQSNYLLDTQPLRRLLLSRLSTEEIPLHISTGQLRGIAISATSYATSHNVTFFDAAPDVQPWVRGGRVSVREHLTVEHIMASSAIPMFFPPVCIRERAFGDGGVRMTAPLSPAIHMGADRILAVGIKHKLTREEARALLTEANGKHVSTAQISGVLLNALFLDSLDDDMERLQRVNRTLSAIPESVRPTTPDALRRIPALLLSPSIDLGHLAADEYRKFPWMLRHLLRGIGATGDYGWDLMSYLAFQPGYIHRLIELGESDTLARRAELEAFFDVRSNGVKLEHSQAV